LPEKKLGENCVKVVKSGTVLDPWTIMTATSRMTYNRNDGGSDVSELHTTLMKCPHKQLAVFACVFVFHCIVCLHYFLL